MGPGKKNSEGKTAPMCLKAGDTITFSKDAGTEIEHQGEQLLVMSEVDVLAKLE